MTTTSGPIMATHTDSDTQNTNDRRRFLRRLSGLGAGVVGAIAFTWADAPAAAAYTVGCCTLATTTPCGGHWNNNGNFSCPSGTTKHYWACCCGYFIYHCWECDNGTTCNNGSVYKCSNWWNYYLAGCCNSACSCPYC